MANLPETIGSVQTTEIAAYARQYPEMGAAEVAKRFHLPSRQVIAHWPAIKAQATPKITIAMAAAGSSSNANHAANMVSGDRDTALRVVRNSYKVLAIMTGRMLAEIEDYDDEMGVPPISKDATTALLNIQRLAAGMIDAHPGLTSLAADPIDAGAGAGGGHLTREQIDAHVQAILTVTVE